jgi:type IV secretory pathway protease TraF
MERLEEIEALRISGSTASFDSRYSGPVSLESVIGEASPLWTR